jgi:hypothetical protein
MLKKSVLLILFLIPGISLFASGHGLNGLEVIYEFAIAVLIYLVLFIVLTILTAINKSKPKRSRTIIYTIVLSIFSVIFLFAVSAIVVAMMTLHRSGLTFGTVPIIVFSVFLVLNITFLSQAYTKLKK